MKGRIELAVAMLLACGCSPAQDQVVYLPAQPKVEGMEAPTCFVSGPAADDSRLHLRLAPTHAAKWIRMDDARRTGEGDGAWQPEGDTVSLETYYSSNGMPALPAALSKQKDGSLVAEGIGTLAPAACWPLSAMAYELPMATLQIPEGMEVTSREDTRDFGTGQPGMYIIVESPDQKGFLGLISFIYADADAPPMDVRAEAVSTAKPYDKSLTSDAAIVQTIGGLPGAKYDGTEIVQAVAMRSVGYAIDYHGCRMTVKLEGDVPSQEMIRRLVSAVESLTWKDYTCPQPTSS